MGAIFGLPDAPTVLFIVALVVVIVYLLWRDRSPIVALQTQFESERKARADEAVACAAAIARCEAKIEVLDAEVRTVRSDRHALAGRLATNKFALQLVRDAHDDGACASSMVAKVFARLDESEADAASHGHRRSGD